MDLPVTQRATYADLEAVHPHLVAEILYGKLVTHPRPRQRHSRAAGRIMQVLGGPFDLGENGPGGWNFYAEAEFHFGEHVTVPDVAGFRAGRSIEPYDGVFITTVPDWVCEVLSPSTEPFDRGPKRQIYAEAGIAHYWLLDPLTRVLEVLELRHQAWTLVNTFVDTDMIVAPPFEAVPLPLEKMLPFLMPRPQSAP
jgi:Uma2 family endonuclease